MFRVGIECTTPNRKKWVRILEYPSILDCSMLWAGPSLWREWWVVPTMFVQATTTSNSVSIRFIYTKINVNQMCSNKNTRCDNNYVKQHKILWFIRHVCYFADTSFMYILGGLLMLRLFQSRHPDINANAHTSYLALALIIGIAVVGVVRSTDIIKI